MQKSVLIIEDDILLVSVLAKNIEKAGYHVESVGNAEEALKRLEGYRPEIILLDILLPGLNGFDFLQIVKKDERLNGIPIIILSNFGSKDDIDKGLVMGADAYLIKANVMPEDILKKIDLVLAERRSV